MKKYLFKGPKKGKDEDGDDDYDDYDEDDWDDDEEDWDDDGDWEEDM
ncbi:MAG: hypothetical protein ACFFAS_09710 [Promethearchaeota archaeon]